MPLKPERMSSGVKSCPDDPEVRYELYRGYNDWLETFTAACPERLIGASQIPLDDPNSPERDA